MKKSLIVILVVGGLITADAAFAGCGRLRGKVRNVLSHLRPHHCCAKVEKICTKACEKPTEGPKEDTEVPAP